MVERAPPALLLCVSNSLEPCRGHPSPVPRLMHPGGAALLTFCDRAAFRCRQQRDELESAVGGVLKGR